MQAPTQAHVTPEPVARRVPLPACGGEMALLDFGPPERGVEVVFSHANGFNARTYRTILQPLAREMRILAVDLRGHGRSTLPAVIEGRLGWREMEDDLLGLLAAETDGPVILAGHSMGATTSLLAAAAQPTRVKGLVLFDPVIFPAEAQADAAESPLVQGALRRRATFPGKAAALEAYVGRGAFKTWRREQIADYVEDGFRDTGDGEVTLTCTPDWEASNFRTHNYDPWAAFAKSRCPIDIRRAEMASTCRLDDREAELMTDGRIRVETMPGTSHFLPMERPDVVAAALRQALAG